MHLLNLTWGGGDGVIEVLLFNGIGIFSGGGENNLWYDILRWGAKIFQRKIISNIIRIQCIIQCIVQCIISVTFGKYFETKFHQNIMQNLSN